MYTQSFALAGYLPNFTAEQAGKAKDQMTVTDGKNFAWTSRGVFSAYSNYLVGKPSDATLMRHPGMFIAKQKVHLFYRNGVWLVEDNGSFTQVFSFANAPAFNNPAGYALDAYKWTTCFVGTCRWFCHPLVGLVYYDEYSDEWGFFRDDCWGGPVFGCCEASNRLVVLLSDVVAWSMVDRGNQFVVDEWRCGSGAQSLALIEYGQPFTVMPYNGGWLTFTSAGTLTSAPDESMVANPDMNGVAPMALVYAHRALSQEDILIGPCAATHLDERAVVWLTQKGFRSFAAASGGGFGSVDTWQAPMSAFYAEHVLPNARGMDLDQFCLEVARDCGWLFVSSRGQDEQVLGYSRAHVFQPEIEKWGCFDYPHLTVGRARRSTIQPDLGFMDAAGRFKDVDHSLHGIGNSWVKFSPVRLQIPNDQSLPPGTMTATQDFKIGVGMPNWSPEPGLQLASAWANLEVKQFTPLPATHAQFFVYSGFDAETPNNDMQQWLHEVSRHHSVLYAVATSTGVLHTMGALADAVGEFFHITSIEIGYTYAGVK